MISGFLTSVISSLRPRQHIEERLTLIIDFTIFYSGFFSSESLPDKLTYQSSQYRCSRRYRSLYKRDCYLVRRSREGHGMSSDNGAHRCVDYCFCKRTAIISAAKVRHCKCKDCPDALFLCRENGANRSCFSGIFAHFNKDLLYLIGNKVDYWSRTNPGYCV